LSFPEEKTKKDNAAHFACIMREKNNHTKADVRAKRQGTTAQEVAKMAGRLKHVES